MAARPSSPTLELLALAAEWEARLSDRLHDLGLTTRRYGLLAHIAAVPDVSFSELARRTGVTVQSAHAAARALAAAGLVADATAHAGSASTLRVTQLGHELLELARERLAELDRELRAERPAVVDALGEPHEDYLAPEPGGR